MSPGDGDPGGRRSRSERLPRGKKAVRNNKGVARPPRTVVANAQGAGRYLTAAEAQRSIREHLEWLARPGSHEEHVKAFDDAPIAKWYEANRARLAKKRMGNEDKKRWREHKRRKQTFVGRPPGDIS